MISPDLAIIFIYLRIYNLIGEQDELLTTRVNVLLLPSIIKFECSKENIAKNEYVNFTWEVENFSKIQLLINDQIHDVTALTNKSFSFDKNSFVQLKTIKGKKRDFVINI